MQGDQQKKNAKVIKAKKDLQIRVGTGAIDTKVVENAQKVLDDTEVDFEPMARPELEKLHKAIEMAKKGEADDEEIMNALRTPIMNLKANAGTFKYEFVSQLTGMVLFFLEGVDKPDSKIVQVVDILHKTILLALAYNMKGDGGQNGKILLETFKEVCEKVQKERQQKAGS